MGGLRCSQALATGEDSGEGKGQLLLRLCSGICGRPRAAWGLCPLAVGLDLCAPPPPPVSSSPFPRWVYSCHMVGFLQPKAPAGAAEIPPARAPQPSHLPGGEPACSLWAGPLLAAPRPESSLVSGCPPGRAEPEEQTLGGAAVSSAPGPPGPRAARALTGSWRGAPAQSVLYLLRTWASSPARAYARHTCFCGRVPAAFAVRAEPRSFAPHAGGPCGTPSAGHGACPLSPSGRRAHVKPWPRGICSS